MAKREFDKSVNYWILSAANLLETAANEVLGPHGITFRQVQVLGCLDGIGEMTQVELAQRLQVEPSTIGRILDRMERDGWVERFPSPTDRRAKFIRTTDKVEPVWQTIQEAGAAIRQRVLAGLDPQQVETLVQALQTICGNLAVVK